MPVDRQKYPSDWQAIATEVKTRAGWQCELCKRPCKRLTETWDQFKYRLARRSKALYDECCEKKMRFVLTTSHVDHDTTNNQKSNLRALCSSCHLRYDAVYHAENAAKTRAAKLKNRLKSAKAGNL